MLSNKISGWPGAKLISRFSRQAERGLPPEDRSATVDDALAVGAAKMFDYLRDRDYAGSIECSPKPGEEWIVLHHFFGLARENDVQVRAQVKHGYVVFDTSQTSLAPRVAVAEDAAELDR